MNRWGAVLLTAATLSAPASVAAKPSSRVLLVEVALSPAARRMLAAAHEAITVAGAFYGNPSRAGKRHADQVGQVSLLRSERALPAAGGVARFPLAAIPPARLRWIRGPVSVNVNVYSARRHFRDNVLACDFIDGPLPAEARGPIRLRCGLIRENPKTRAIS